MRQAMQLQFHLGINNNPCHPDSCLALSFVPLLTKKNQLHKRWESSCLIQILSPEMCSSLGISIWNCAVVPIFSRLYGRPLMDVSVERIGGRDVEAFWLGDGSSVQHIRLADIPNTLSGDILRLHQNLPDIEGSFEIDGDEIHHIDNVPPLRVYDDDFEDMTPALADLPLVQVDPSKHHTKKGRYQSEVYNLLRCQGGSCP